jgi:predicted dehydrogenase
MRDLVQAGYVGRVRAVRMSVGVDAFGEVMPAFARWTLDAANFTNVLSIYGAHFQDMLFHAVGFPDQLTAVMEPVPVDHHRRDRRDDPPFQCQ